MHTAAAENAVLTKAVVRAADQLGVTSKTLSAIIGVSEATVSQDAQARFPARARIEALRTGRAVRQAVQIPRRHYRRRRDGLESLDQKPEPRARSEAAGKDPHHSRAARCHLLSGHTPRSRLRRSRWKARCWRLVEAQHRVSTLKLVDTLEEQALLEDLIEETKPAIPAECRHLDYLLATPFRYGSIYPNGSRFRRAGRTKGVFYAAETVATAVAEMAFYRLLFFADSPQTPWPKDAAEYTAFSVAIRTGRAIDLTKPPLSRDNALWTRPSDYEACQKLAEAAREAELEAIRYQSVRDPGKAGQCRPA